MVDRSGVFARLRRGAVRARLFLLVVAALTVTVVAVTVRSQHRATPDPTVGDVVRVGVADGGSVPDYLRASSEELRALSAATPTGEVYALVALAEYVDPDRLPPLLGGAAVAEVYARVPLPDRQTEIVRLAAQRLPDDVTGGMDRVADRKRREADRYRRLLADLSGDGGRERDLREVYRSGADLATAEATAYAGHCACVYAAVVRATPSTLAVLAGRPGVRAVDPAPEVRRLDRAVFRAPLPEQRERALPPGPVPSTTTPPEPDGTG